MPAQGAAGPPRRLYRDTSSRVLAGVAGGIAEHLSVDVLVVRLAFVVLSFAGGAGVLAYMALWVFVPPRMDPSADGPTSERTARRTRTDRDALIALVVLAVGILLLGQALGIGVPPALSWPAMLGGAGLVILWRQADDTRRAKWRAAAKVSPGIGPWVRTVAGVVLVVGGGALFLAAEGQLAAAREGLFATAVVVAGLALVTGPFWLRTVRELAEERRARIRSQERAEVAAHVHDSVLHTLALIQRQSDDPREVQRLARSQERALRSWLYRPSVADGGMLAAAMEAVAAEVEEGHGVPLDVVVVGDCPLDARLTALLAAAREAMVNAAKYAGMAPVSVYAEVEEDEVTVFVRDRGPGFDQDLVPPDRMGVRESIIGRMRRNGGRAVVRSAGEEGTEVELAVPREEQTSGPSA